MQGRCFVADDKKTGAKSNPAQCIFDVFGLKFYMTREEAVAVVGFDETGAVSTGVLERTGADSIDLFFDHTGKLWQVKARYNVAELSEGEAMVDKMSKDYRFQTPTCRVAFEVTEDEAGHFVMNVRYTEINLKRSYIHHKMAEGAKLTAEDEKRRVEKSIEDMEEEDYIPTGPMMF